MSAVVTAAEPQWVDLFAGLNGRQFRKLVGVVRRRHPAGTVLIVDGTQVPTRDRSVAASSKNYR